ncbi:hypothetical protein FO519_008312 [Halicephalobus sp. NKZ332]|nr:hypothetical protein FO519_008312 [Halicephalobus sp. NKZ332]
MAFAPAFFGIFKSLLGPHLVLGIFWQILYHSLLTTYLLDLVISINRLTAVLIPLRYTSFWNRKIKWVIAFIIIVPYSLFWPIPFEDVMVEYNGDRNEYYVIFGRSPPITWPYVTSIIGTGSLVTCICCFFCNAYVGFKMYKNRNASGDPNYQQDKVYFFFMLCVFAGQILSSSFQWMLNYANPDDVWIYIRRFQFVAYDISNLLPAWTLFLMSRILRKAICETITKRFENSTKSNVVTMIM